MRRLFILRPQPGADESVERAKAMGLDAVAMPLFQIEPVEWQGPEASSFDGLLLTSANAVRQAGSQLSALHGLRVYAVGEATCDAAREAGFDIAATGDAGAERLLGSVESNLRLLHLCGEHRTAVDAKQAITAVPVYRSAELPAPDVAQFTGQTVAVHSPRAGARLAGLVADRGSIRIAAISEAAASAAGRGWEACEAAERPDDGALLALAARLCDYCGQ